MTSTQGDTDPLNALPLRPPGSIQRVEHERNFSLRSTYIYTQRHAHARESHTVAYPFSGRIPPPNPYICSLQRESVVESDVKDSRVCGLQADWTSSVFIAKDTHTQEDLCCNSDLRSHVGLI